MGLGRLIRRDTPPPTTRPHTRAAGENLALILEQYPLNPMSAYRGGMSIPGAWRCALVLSDLLGSVPWHAYRERGGDPVEVLDPNPPLLEQPAPPDTRMTTVSSLGLDLIWHGNALAVIAARNFEGWPTAVTPVRADSVGVRRRIDTGAIEYSIGTDTYGTDEVVHVKGPCEPGALRGFGVLEAHLGTLELAREQSRQAHAITEHGVPTGTLRSDNPDLTEPEANELKRKWLDAQAQRSIAVLNPTTHFEPLAWNPEELQLVQARKFSLHEIALIFGLPLSFLGVETSNRTYRNDETEQINLVKFSLRGHLERFEQTLTGHFPRGTKAKANLDAILRADTLSRYRAHEIALKNGFMTVDEVRDLEDRPPLAAADNTTGDTDDDEV